MAISKVERLLNLMNVLLDAPRAVSAAQIRAQVPGYADSEGAFHRTFERDKDDLREMGVPLLVEEVSGSDPPIIGYRIRKDDYYLRDPGLVQRDHIRVALDQDDTPGAQLRDEDARLTRFRQVDGVEVRVGKVVRVPPDPAMPLEEDGERLDPAASLQRPEGDVVVAERPLRELDERARVGHVGGIAVPEVVEESHGRPDITPRA